MTVKILLPAGLLGIAGAVAAGMPASAAVASPPPGYRVAVGPIVTFDNGVQQRSTATCPGGTVPLGGGAFVSADGLATGVSSSFPTRTGWTATVNNVSGSAASFEVTVACAKKPAHYSIVTSKPVLNPSGSRTTVTLSCPKPAKPLGGGTQSSGGLFANLGASFPLKNGWRVAESNATASNATVKEFLVCGTIPGYQLVPGRATVLPANQQTGLLTVCPPGRVILGGGSSVSTTSVGVAVSETAPIDPAAALTAGQPSAWLSTVNNATAIDATGTTFAICAGR